MKTFPIGGVHPSDNKLSRAVAVERFALPDEVRIPLAQHIGAPAVAKVAKGDKVLAGQLIAEAASFMSANIHAPVSGTVTAVDLQPNGQGVRQMMITIKREGDEWVPEVDLTPDLVRECTLEPKEILDRIKAAGIVGMGGATFPTHVKLSVPPGKKTEFLIINGVECEPYLTSDHRTMLEKGEELMVGTTILMRVLGVKQAQIGIENNKPDAIAFLRELSKHYEGVRVTPLKVRYPQGGEKQLIAAVTGRQVPPPPGLPIDVGAVVCNASTTVAVYEAVQKRKPLVERIVTVTGKGMKTPSNYLVRMGTPIASLVEAAGGLPEGDVKVLNGGPMMGRIGNGSDPVTKTTNAVLVLPRDHQIVMKKQRTSAIDLKRAASICCQCNTCTDLCPRHNLGHPIDPARFMRAASAGDFRDVNPYIDSAFCSSCGVCEMYACPQSLAPRTLLADMKGGLRKAGIRPPQGVQPVPVQPSREYRKVPEERLMARLGLTKYDKDAPMDENVVPASKVKILLSQHIGAPAQAIVKTGDTVTKGQMIAQHADGLSVSIHASISGRVTEVTDRHIIIAAK